MKSYFETLLAATTPCALFWGIAAYSMHKDRSRYRNCIFLFLALVFTLPFLSALLGPVSDYVLPVMGLIFVLIILMLPFSLISNGITMLRKEGSSLANLLSLFAGIFLLVSEISGVFLILGPYIKGSSQWNQNLSLWFVFLILSAFYFSFSFFVFLVYCRFLQVIPRKRDFDYVIIHGSGLIHGSEVSKLLSGRIDKALEVYHKDPTPPVLIPSGGQGGDETVAEGDAMAKYIRAKGIPEDHILVENRSANTFANLENSKKLIEERESDLSKCSIALVTSDYHVYRALRLCRKLGMKCTGIGSRTAAYYMPSAMLREYIAVHHERKHFLLLMSGWLIVLIPLFLLILEQMIKL